MQAGGKVGGRWLDKVEGHRPFANLNLAGTKFLVCAGIADASSSKVEQALHFSHQQVKCKRWWPQEQSAPAFAATGEAHSHMPVSQKTVPKHDMPKHDAPGKQHKPQPSNSVNRAGLTIA